MISNLKNIIIGVLISILICMGCIIFEQREQINMMQSEIQSNREFINTELHMIDSIYDNNYKLWDSRVDILLQCFEEQGYLIRK
jgi:hypothetical protein